MALFLVIAVQHGCKSGGSETKSASSGEDVQTVWPPDPCSLAELPALRSLVNDKELSATGPASTSKDNGDRLCIWTSAASFVELRTSTDESRAHAAEKNHLPVFTSARDEFELTGGEILRFSGSFPVRCSTSKFDVQLPPRPGRSCIALLERASVSLEVIAEAELSAIDEQVAILDETAVEAAEQIQNMR